MSANRTSDCTVKPLAKEDINEADRITRLAFGTFLNLPDPMTMFGDRDMIRNRVGDTSVAVGAYMDDRLIGLNVISSWGKFGWFGPLAVLPEFWDKGIAKLLLNSTMEIFSKWKTSAEGLFTFADSPKHVGLYHKFGFSARFLTPVMIHEAMVTGQDYLTFSKLETDKQRNEILGECREISETLYPGLDLTNEIRNVSGKSLGDTVLLRDGSRLQGFAVCHVGAGTEAGRETCYVKFGAVSRGVRSKDQFPKLVRACLGFAASNGAKNLEAGVNLGRNFAFDEMGKLGFKTLFQGVAMQRPNEPGFNRPDVYAIDDWR
jgi:GNAT superfamily N-acetyltransferase